MLSRFKTPAVRDLVWMLSSPSLLDAPESEDGAVLSNAWSKRQLLRCVVMLEELDRSPKPLLEFIARHRKTGRLGDYFETLVRFWIEHLSGYQLIAVNVQVRGEKQTLGEMDLLVRDPESGQAEHWELSVKFYISAALDPRECADPSYYIGQMVKDRLDLKANKLLRDQLQLSRKPEAREVLAKLGVEGLRSRALVRGMLFYPDAQEWRAQSGPRGVSLDHLKGWWIPFSDSLGLPRSEGEIRYVILAKDQWLSSWHPGWTSDRLTRAQLQEWFQDYFVENQKGRMIAEIRIDGPEPRELSRGFILHPEWLERARRTLEDGK